MDRDEGAGVRSVLDTAPLFVHLSVALLEPGLGDVGGSPPWALGCTRTGGIRAGDRVEFKGSAHTITITATPRRLISTAKPNGLLFAAAKLRLYAANPYH